MDRMDLKEDISRGTSDFPIDYHYVDYRHPRFQMTTHWHFELEMIRMASGVFDLYLDGVLHRMFPGDIAFVDGGTLHGGRITDGGSYECIIMDPELIRHRNYRDDSFIKKALHHKIRLSPVVRKDVVESDPTLSFAVRSIYSSVIGKEPGYEAEFTGALRIFFSSFERLGLWQRDEFAERNGSARTEQMRSVIEHIEEHYAEDMTLDDLAGVAGLSDRYFCTFFKELTGRTCFEYIRLVRMENAAIMLRDPDLSIAEVAYAVGYEDTSYFTRIFRKTMGLSPRDYRKDPHLRHD